MKLCFLGLMFFSSSCVFGLQTVKWPTIAISVLVRNKAISLPYFLKCIRDLSYPKDRIYIWIHSDYNDDNSIEVLQKWNKEYSHEYHSVYLTTNSSTAPFHPDEGNTPQWTQQHFQHIIHLREKALNFARRSWSDFLLMIDADVFLTHPETLQYLMNKNLTIVAPMLISDGLYSNFWCGMTSNYYYERTDNYKPILNREEKGCFEVPMVHTAVFINLNVLESDKLTYDPKNIKNYDGPEDDIIAFAINAKKHGVSLNICNDQLYGFLSIPLEENQSYSNEYDQLLNVKLEAISRGLPIPVENVLLEFVNYPKLWKFTCDEIFMINLKRRSERRKLMFESFRELGMDVTLFEAIDGRDINLDDCEEIINLMPEYEDPYHKRPIKAGEIGCFLSHYRIWKKIIENGYGVTLVLEDDIRFVPYFRHKLQRLLNEIKSLDWEFMYIGRKILDSEETYVLEHVVQPSYSYWTLGYLITLSGAKKLIKAKPLINLLPVDEFIPIMFDKHPNDTWKSYFHTRNLKAYSASELLVHPTHYTGQEGYISDTEDSSVMDGGELKNLDSAKTEL